ncbi:L-tartrate dehydratase subunit alpha [Escherichia coli]|nr:L-tartrate dehydratase subunit alpha [Escherichia coli]
MMSESNKQQAVNKLTEIVANFTAMISTRMPDDVVDKLKQLKDAETSSMGKIIYHTMFDNMQKAIDLNRPACQDTGEIMFFVKVGSRFPLLGELQSILKQAVEEATVKAPLRHNAVEIFDEVNTGKNTGSGVPWVTWDIVPDGDDAEIEVYMAGGGCTLPGRSKVLMPSEGYEGVVKFVFENISTLAVNACPPVLVGVGIATSVETAAVLSRKAIFAPDWQPPPQSESGRAGATPGRRTQPFGDWSTRADWQQFSDGRTYRICRPPSVNHRRCCFYRLLGASSRHTAGSCRSHL